MTKAVSVATRYFLSSLGRVNAPIDVGILSEVNGVTCDRHAT